MLSEKCVFQTSSKLIIITICLGDAEYFRMKRFVRQEDVIKILSLSVSYKNGT